MKFEPKFKKIETYHGKKTESIVDNKICKKKSDGMKMNEKLG